MPGLFHPSYVVVETTNFFDFLEVQRDRMNFLDEKEAKQKVIPIKD